MVRGNKMSGTVAEVRVGDLPETVRRKLGVADRQADETVRLTTVDGVQRATRLSAGDMIGAAGRMGLAPRTPDDIAIDVRSQRDAWKN